MVSVDWDDEEPLGSPHVICTYLDLRNAALLGHFSDSNLKVTIESARAASRGGSSRGELVGDTLGRRDGNAQQGGNECERKSHVVGWASRVVLNDWQYVYCVVLLI